MDTHYFQGQYNFLLTIFLRIEKSFEFNFFITIHVHTVKQNEKTMKNI